MNNLCDCCGENIKQHTYWQISLKFVSFWNPQGDKRNVNLCEKCGIQAANLLGFCHDTGKILSIAKKEQIDSVTVYGAFPGIVGANLPQWHANNPGAAVMGEIKKKTNTEERNERVD